MTEIAGNHDHPAEKELNNLDSGVIVAIDDGSDDILVEEVIGGREEKELRKEINRVSFDLEVKDASEVPVAEDKVGPQPPHRQLRRLSSEAIAKNAHSPRVQGSRKARGSGLDQDRVLHGAGCGMDTTIQEEHGYAPNPPFFCFYCNARDPRCMVSGVFLNCLPFPTVNLATCGGKTAMLLLLLLAAVYPIQHFVLRPSDDQHFGPPADIPLHHSSQPVDPAAVPPPPAPVWHTPIDSQLKIGVSSILGGYRFYLKVSLPQRDGTITRPLSLMLDTGSSTAAFCDYSLQAAVNHTALSTISCNLYGTGASGYQGPFFEGTMHLAGQALPLVKYAMMQFQADMPCIGGYDGIFGAAFKGMDQAYPATGYAAAATNYSSAASWCSHAQEMAPADYMSPLIRSVTEGTGPSSHAWGLLHYAAISNAELKTADSILGDDAGVLLLGEKAKNNSWFDPKSALIAKLYNAYSFSITDWSYYNVQIRRWVVGGASFSASVPKASFSQGIIDTGTPYIELPFTICKALNDNPQDTLVIYINGVNGQEIALTLGTGYALSTAGPGGVPLYQAAPASPYNAPVYTIGYPLWLFYYTMFDVQNHQLHLGVPKTF